MEGKKILVTGGSGMVGNHLKNIMPDAIYISSRNYNLTRENDVISMFTKYRPDVVIHLAAKVGGITDNINHPADYFEQNILMNTLVLKWALFFKVKQFIGMLSTCIYPDIMPNYPMIETDLHLGAPPITNFAYAYAKRSFGVQIDSYNKQYGTSYNYLLPCNMYSEYDKFGESNHFVTALIKKIHTAKLDLTNTISLFGTGKPLRQFMYAGDLAKVIKICIENNITDSFNVASPENYSINDLAQIALKVCDAENFKIEYDLTKPDGQFRKDVLTDKMNTLIPDFKFTSLSDGIKKVYDLIY